MTEVRLEVPKLGKLLVGAALTIGLAVTSVATAGATAQKCYTGPGIASATR